MAGAVRGALLCWAVACCCLALPAAAVDSNPQAEQLQKRIRAVQSSLGLVETRKDSLQGELGEIERHSGELAKRLRGLSKDIANQKQQLVHIRQQKDKLLASLREHNRGLDNQVRSAFMAGRQEWIKLLLNPDDPARVSRMLTYYGYLNRSRLAQLRSINEGLAQVEGMEQSIQAETARLEHLLADERGSRNDLGEAQRDRASTVAKLHEELRDKSARSRELSGNMQRLDRLVSSMDLALADMPPAFPAPAAKAKAAPAAANAVPAPSAVPPAAAQWPVTGPVLKRFGASRMGGHWDGMLIRAAEGTPVNAASDGRVVFADWMRGYGLLLILEHADGYMSLYAYNQSLYKQVGEQVKAGEMIATVGTSGGHAQASLYFGVRYAGRPVDPLGWLQKRG